MAGMKGLVHNVHQADPWLVLRTRSRHESKVEAALQQKQVETYLPRRRVQRSLSSRRSVVEMPLFPGYVFVRPKPEQYEGMRYVPGSCGLVLSAGRAAVLPERDLDAVILDMPMEFGLEFMTIVGANFPDAKRKFADDVINKINGVGLGMLFINFERADARRIVDRGILKAADFLAAWPFEG